MGDRMEEKRIYRLDDDISFRKCSLYEKNDIVFGDCTSFSTQEIKFVQYYNCNQDGVHYHCTKHPEIEFNKIVDEMSYDIYFECPKCRNKIKIDKINELKSKCLKMLNMEIFKNAKLIRLDDWYFPEIKSKEKTESGYWIHSDVKTDKDGDTIIVLYVGHKDSKEKVQYFIKPEKGQLTSDHKDLDPSKIISKIEVQLKGRKITHEYEEE